MKKMLVLMLALLFVGFAYAQDSRALIGEVPFAFHVGNAKLPAGEYLVGPILSGNPYLLSVRSVEVKEPASALIISYGISTNKAPETAKLVFTKYADGNYFLSEIWHPYSNTGVHTVKTSRERESVTSRLVAGTPPETVIILARVAK
jgi:hypothetical protein